MRFASTRGSSAPVRFSEAMELGLAPDGGLYVPESFPTFEAADFDGLNSVAEIGARFLAPFFEKDRLAAQLPSLCAKAFDFALPLRRLDEATEVLELFHGPTAAFKDVGARFLAECFTTLGPATGGGTRTILVATSGDTGGAVAAAFHGKPGINVVVLFPAGRVSPRQEKQLTCWDGNVKALKVRGTFDDCQRLVKAAFADAGWRKSAGLTSANSINIGRLLPQSVYYAAASLWHFRARGSAASFVVPTGNAGNVVAAFWARRAGLPLGHLALATNANKVVPEFFASGVATPRPSIATIANAMDVGNPSNLERLTHLFTKFQYLFRDASAASVDDRTIRATIKSEFASTKTVFCPHTATALWLRRQRKEGEWIVVATAHPAKFEDVVEPLTGPVAVPPQLAALLSKPSQATEIDADLKALRAAI